MITLLLCILCLGAGFGIGFKSGVYIAYTKWKDKAKKVTGETVIKIAEKYVGQSKEKN